MIRVSTLATALLPVLLSLQAQAAAPLPDAPAVQAAIRRAIEAELPSTKGDEAPDFGQALIMGRLLSIEVVDVPGCVPLETDRLNCIVSFDKGFGQIRHQAMRMEQRDGRWEILRPEQDAQQEHAPPAPTPLQAQAAVREYASGQLARGITDDELRRAATGFQASSLSDCRLSSDAAIACDVEFSLPATPGTTEAVHTARMRFRLQGSAWRYGEPDPAR